MNRMFGACGRALGFTALHLIAVTTSAAAQQAANEPRLSVTREGERAIVQLVSDSLAGASLSEPFVLEDRTRIYLVLEGTAANLAAASAEAVSEAGLLAVVPEQRDGTLRIAVEVASIGAYGLEQRETGPALWLQQAPAAVAPASVATAAPASVATAAPAPPSSAQRLVQAIAAGAALVAEGAITAAAALRPMSLQLGAGALLLLLPIAAWRIVAMHRGQAATEHDAPRNERSDAVHRPDARTQDARLWAAKTLAQQGALPAEIAERTGLSRDAATLLAITLNAAKAAAPGKNFRPVASSEAHGQRNAVAATP
jgi:hypothetical protein